jgi:hypothetical protein
MRLLGAFSALRFSGKALPFRSGADNRRAMSRVIANDYSHWSKSPRFIAVSGNVTARGVSLFIARAKISSSSMDDLIADRRSRRRSRVVTNPHLRIRNCDSGLCPRSRLKSRLSRLRSTGSCFESRSFETVA